MRISILAAALVVALAAAPGASANAHRGAASQPSSAGAGASRSACSDSAYAFLGPAARWKSTLRWAFRASSVPAGLNTADVLSIIKRSFRNITRARNDCGMPDMVSATSRYLGTTSTKPGVSASADCLGQDGHNVVGFGSLGGYFSGYTCIYWEGDEIVEMDMRLDTDTAWALSMATCDAELMMEALVTHEAGHAFGLGHVSETRHGRQTMSLYIDGLCENQEATLGRGDLLGLQALY
jgi:hypothetical protein